MESFSIQTKAGGAFWFSLSLSLMQDGIMQHGISEQEWIQYIDSNLRAKKQASIRTHVDGCRECAQLLAELSTWQELLKEEASQLRETFQTSQAEIEPLLAQCLARIRTAESAKTRTGLRWTVTEAMSLLRFLLEPICGQGTTQATMNLAIQRSAADRDGHITSQNWKLFIANLSDAIASICGSAAGRLVGRVGICLAIEG